MPSQVQSIGIPTRNVVLTDPSQLPLDYGTTPGGTMFSTTPGGTRIIYERRFLMQCRNSPLAKSPPANLPKIPGVTSPESGAGDATKENGQPIACPKIPESSDEPQFEMDI
jgi:hypothetical protein